MKKLILITFSLLFTTSNLAALTIETATKRNTIYQKPISIQRSFGKLRSTGEYGIYVYVTVKSDDNERSLDTLFFRLNSTVEKRDNFLQTTIDGKTIILAEKKWYGWKSAAGVVIKYRVDGSSSYTVDAWLEIEDALLSQ